MNLSNLSREVWVADRQAFIFWLRPQQLGHQATFCVPEPTLKEVHLRHPFDPAIAFEIWRSVIYKAALERIRVGAAFVHNAISSHELRAIKLSDLGRPPKCLDG
jgi:hypothetical protein